MTNSLLPMGDWSAYTIEDETTEITPPIQLQPFLPKLQPQPLKAKGRAFLPALDAEIVSGCDRQGTQRATDVRTSEDNLFIINWHSKCLAMKKDWLLSHARLGIASCWSSSNAWGHKHWYLTLGCEIFIKKEILTQNLQKYICYVCNMHYFYSM